MSFTQKVIALLENGLFAHIRAIVGANRDYPYHDFHTISDGSEPVNYRVGRNNLNCKGDQSKLFISKETLVYSDVLCTIRLNDANNTPITIRAGVPYWFTSNIRSVYVSVIGSGGFIDLGFEGVLPQEARSAE